MCSGGLQACLQVYYNTVISVFQGILQIFLYFYILHKFEVILLDVLITSNRIKSLCKSNGITVKTLLESTNINRNFIYDLEKSGRIPSADKFERIADCLGCSVDYLLGRTDVPEVNRGPGPKIE